MQPEGLRESSRWSERNEDHRYRVIPTRTLTGCQTSCENLAPLWVLILVVSGVVRPPATLSQPFGLHVSR